MKIILDPQVFNQQYGGISRYFTELLNISKSNASVKIELPLLYSENLHLQQYGLTPTIGKLLALPFFYKKHIIKEKLIQLGLERTKKKLQKGDFDLFLPTYYRTYFLPYLKNKPFVLTVYDMIHERLPQYFRPDGSTIQDKKLLIEKATKIIAISESTKKDILEIYPHISSDKIEVVYLSHSINDTDKKEISNLVSYRYFLFVGNRTLYKNFDFLIRAMAPFMKASGNRLICIGGGAFTQSEIELLNKLGVVESVFQKNAADNELAMYYANAVAFIFPSEYEGFGIPVLEAMACGCPVVLSPVSSFPEVAGDAGVYYETNNPVSLVSCLTQLVNDNLYRNEVITLGYQQQTKFSWNKTAAHCFQVFTTAIQ